MSEDETSRELGVRPIALIGLRCAGKTSVGRELAQRLGLPFADLDQELARGTSATAGELLASEGVDRFRDREQRALERALEHLGRSVLACGGGVVERAANRELLASRAVCVWLREEIAVLQRRLNRDPIARPALLGGDAADELEELSRAREPLYRGLATLTIECRDRSIATIAVEIARSFEGER